ncbi:bifunctional RNase H/acid phosphatase [Streptomyces sp. NPDC047028]|uniref:bifunctional RNase H/acid phosphatase n=1 Tax=Streptomyces sp. NPDC047028 TaxID=3155793 RepID=UPI0033F5BB46
MREFIVEADGGSRGNPGPAGYGAVVIDAATGETLAEAAEYLGVVTNNVAEYRGLLAGLSTAHALDPTARVHVRMDSKLVVEQMSGRWKIKHPDMKPLATQARAAHPPTHVTYEWIPRAQNTHADRLANKAMDAGLAAGSDDAAAAGSRAAGSSAPLPPAAASAAESPTPPPPAAASAAEQAPPLPPAAGSAAGSPTPPPPAAASAAAEQAPPPPPPPAAASAAGSPTPPPPAAASAAAEQAPPPPPAAGNRAAGAARVGAAAPLGEQHPSPPTDPHQTTPAQQNPAPTDPHQPTPAQQNPAPTTRHQPTPAQQNPAPATRHQLTPAQQNPAPNQSSRGWSKAPDLGAPTTLVLLRHGETPLTPQKRFSGSGGTNPSLSDAGRDQAHRSATALAARGTIQAVVASPLARTQETARIVAARLGLDVETDEGLRETDFGAWEGLTFGEVHTRHPDDLTAWLADPEAHPTGGGESFAETAVRIAAARDRLIAAHAGRTVLLVTHVTPVKTLIQLALGAPLKSLFRMELSAASLSAVAYYADGNASVRLFNDTSHLRA